MASPSTLSTLSQGPAQIITGARRLPGNPAGPALGRWPESNVAGWEESPGPRAADLLAADLWARRRSPPPPPHPPPQRFAQRSAARRSAARGPGRRGIPRRRPGRREIPRRRRSGMRREVVPLLRV